MVKVIRMASVTAQNFIDVMNISDSTTNMEYVLDLAIDTLNLYGATTINNMVGSAGSKTVTLTSKQRGGVFHLARIIYRDFYKEAGKTTSIGGLTVTAIELLANPTVESAIEKIARRLSTVDFHVGEDTSGIE